MFDLFKNLIPAKTAIGLMHKALEKELGFAVNNFEMVYNAIEKTVFFDVLLTDNLTRRKYPYEPKGFDMFKVIELLAKKQVKDNAVIDVVKVHFKGSKINVSTYYQLNNEKLKTSYTL